MNEEIKRDLLIAKIGDSIHSEKVRLIRQYNEQIKDIDFICVNKEWGNDNLQEITNSFGILKGNLSSPFYDNHLIVLNSDFVMGRKKVFSYHFDIQLDTNIVSLIGRLGKGQLDEALIDSIRNITKQRNLSSTMSLLCYLDENCLLENKFSDYVKSDIYNFFYVLYSSQTDRKTANKLANEKLEQITKTEYIKPYSYKFIEIYFYNYCMLLELIIVFFQNRNTKERIKAYLTFMNETIYTLDFGMMNIAISFFEKKRDFLFFSKIDKNMQEPIKTIKNMTWDLYHVRNQYEIFKHQVADYKVDITMPLFYSMDNRLNELRNEIKLKCIAVDHKTNTYYPFIENNKLGQYLSCEEQYQYLNITTLENRSKNRKNVDTKKISSILEEELINLLNVK